MGTKTAKTPSAEEAATEGKGGNGQGDSEAPAEGEGPRRKHVEPSPEVKEWWPYFGCPLVVQLKEGMVVVDCVGMVQMPVGQEGQMRPFGVPGKMRPRDPDTNELGKPFTTDVFEEVMMQPSPCGKKLMLIQRTDTMPGGSGAIIAYTIRPEAIHSIAHVEMPPQRLERPEGRRIITPG